MPQAEEGGRAPAPRFCKNGRYAELSHRASGRQLRIKKLKMAEKHWPLGGHMHASSYIIVEEQWTTL
jgi:hypothetical protein